jgi:hypothetical protein
MFGFSKKKSEPVAPVPPAQNAQNITLMQPASKPFGFPQKPVTRVEDETATFQIPDFTEDDLNFDLGIGEFIPNPNAPNANQNVPNSNLNAPSSHPAPNQMRSTNPSAPATQNYARDDLPPPVPEMQMQQYRQEMMQQEAQMPQNTAVEQQQMSPPQMQPEAEVQMQEPELELEELPPLDDELAVPVQKAPEQKPVQNVPVQRQQVEHEAEEEFPEFSTEEDIPMFSVETETEKQRKAEEKIHAKNFKKEVDSFLESAKRELHHPGVFMPYTIYEKVVILTEDTVKQSNNGDLAKNKVSSIMEHKKTHVEELSKMSKSIIDSLLNCDAKLFEKVGENE